jgi:hypothetical protein
MNHFHLQRSVVGRMKIPVKMGYALPERRASSTEDTGP